MHAGIQSPGTRSNTATATVTRSFWRRADRGPSRRDRRRAPGRGREARSPVHRGAAGRGNSRIRNGGKMQWPVGCWAGVVYHGLSGLPRAEEVGGEDGNALVPQVGRHHS
jgi:hypothetical protein